MFKLAASLLGSAGGPWGRALVVLVWHWREVAVVLAVAVAYHKGAAAARDATALRDARATIAHQEAVSRRNEEAAYTAQYNAAVRAADNEDLQRRLDAYAAELKTQSEASVAREEELVKHNDETVAQYEARLRKAAAAVGTGACTLGPHDIGRLRGLAADHGGRTRPGARLAR